MSAIGSIQSTIGSLTGLSKTQETPSANFGDVLTGAIENVANTQQKAEQMSVAAANGEDVPMHEVIRAVSEADLTLQTMLAVRDKAVDAYNEIIRMPI